jgi:hypothetical protein
MKFYRLIFISKSYTTKICSTYTGKCQNKTRIFTLLSLGNYFSLENNVNVVIKRQHWASQKHGYLSLFLVD